jgi:hypothetical protein
MLELRFIASIGSKREAVREKTQMIHVCGLIVFHGESNPGRRNAFFRKIATVLMSGLWCSFDESTDCQTFCFIG